MRNNAGFPFAHVYPSIGLQISGGTASDAGRRALWRSWCGLGQAQAKSAAAVSHRGLCAGHLLLR